MAFKFGYKEIAAISALVLLIVISTVAVLIKDVDELVDPDISLSVDQTYVTNDEIQNITPVQGRSWQVIEVLITNNNDEKEFLVSVPHFFAYTQSGEKLWVFNGEDFQYDPIEPGQDLTVKLIFQIPEGEELVKLEYTQKLSSAVKCDIPEVEE